MIILQRGSLLCRRTNKRKILVFMFFLWIFVIPLKQLWITHRLFFFSNSLSFFQVLQSHTTMTGSQAPNTLNKHLAETYVKLKTQTHTLGCAKAMTDGELNAFISSNMLCAAGPSLCFCALSGVIWKHYPSAWDFFLLLAFIKWNLFGVFVYKGGVSRGLQCKAWYPLKVELVPTK